MLYYEIFKLEIFNKHCIYNKGKYQDILDNIRYIQLSIPVKVKDGKKIIDYSEVGFNEYYNINDSGGWGIITKRQ